MAFERLKIELGDRSYPILIGKGLIRDSELLAAHISSKHLLVVTNEQVAPLYLNVFKAALQSKKIAQLILPDGEAHKNLETLSRVFDACVAEKLNRDAAIVALGGGVVGDMAGFAAACYQRGIDYIQIPTTLLAQVDSAVGGKTAINHPGGKNLIGAFHQPRCVIADTEVLNTLPDRELRAGLAEVIKYGLIRDRTFLSWLEANNHRLLNRDSQALTHAILRSCEIKAEIVGIDEREHGLRAILNFGHTFGHAIENAVGYGEWLHGEAVAAGMVLAATLSARLGWIDQPACERTVNLLRASGLPVNPPKIGSDRALQLMGMDKKVLGGKLRLVLLRALGEAVVTDSYDVSALKAVLQHGFD